MYRPAKGQLFAHSFADQFSMNQIGSLLRVSYKTKIKVMATLSSCLEIRSRIHSVLIQVAGLILFSYSSKTDVTMFLLAVSK